MLLKEKCNHRCESNPFARKNANNSHWLIDQKVFSLQCVHFKNSQKHWIKWQNTNGNALDWMLLKISKNESVFPVFGGFWQHFIWLCIALHAKSKQLTLTHCPTGVLVCRMHTASFWHQHWVKWYGNTPIVMSLIECCWKTKQQHISNPCVLVQFDSIFISAQTNFGAVWQHLCFSSNKAHIGMHSTHSNCTHSALWITNAQLFVTHVLDHCHKSGASATETCNNAWNREPAFLAQKSCLQNAMNWEGCNVASLWNHESTNTDIVLFLNLFKQDIEWPHHTSTKTVTKWQQGANLHLVWPCLLFHIAFTCWAKFITVAIPVQDVAEDWMTSTAAVGVQKTPWEYKEEVLKGVSNVGKWKS